MPIPYELRLGGSPVSADFYTSVHSVEVEENVEAPDALLLRLPVTRTAEGDLGFVDGRVEPYTQVAVTVLPADGPAACVFDGYVLAWNLRLDRAVAESRIEVWAQDASWLMNTDTKVREWSGRTDGEVANAIFGEYGFAAADGNTADDSPSHDKDTHTLMQRDTDLRFLRGLARRGGRILRVACTDTPGARTGYFVAPDVGADRVATLSFTDGADWTVDGLDFSWDVMRPSKAASSQISFDDSSGAGVSGDASGGGLAAMADRGLAAYAGRDTGTVLTAAADPEELPRRTTALVRDAGWLARCKGTADSDRLGAVLRAGSVVAVEGAGTLHSGTWFVWSVRHEFTRDDYRMHFTLVRNAVGGSGTGG
jgi:hypothetical protein